MSCKKSLSYLSDVLQMTISQLKAELEKGPQEAAVYTQQIHELQSNLNNLQQLSQVSHIDHQNQKATIILAMCKSFMTCVAQYKILDCTGFDFNSVTLKMPCCHLPFLET